MAHNYSYVLVQFKGVLHSKYIENSKGGCLGQICFRRTSVKCGGLQSDLHQEVSHTVTFTYDNLLYF